MFLKILAATAATAITAGLVRRWVINTLAEIDEALCILSDLEGVPYENPAEPCVCGSTEHTATRLVVINVDALLENGDYGVLPLGLQFQYSESDPLAVTMLATVEVDVEGKVVGVDQQAWCLDRDIIDTALSREDGSMVGDGDVRAQYNSSVDELWLHLTGEDGKLRRVDIPAPPMREFMAATFHVVPAGAEEPLVESAITKLLDGTWEQ